MAAGGADSGPVAASLPALPGPLAALRCPEPPPTPVRELTRVLMGLAADDGPAAAAPQHSAHPPLVRSRSAPPRPGALPKPGAAKTKTPPKLPRRPGPGFSLGPLPQAATFLREYAPTACPMQTLPDTDGHTDPANPASSASPQSAGSLPTPVAEHPPTPHWDRFVDLQHSQDPPDAPTGKIDPSPPPAAIPPTPLWDSFTSNSPFVPPVRRVRFDPVVVAAFTFSPSEYDRTGAADGWALPAHMTAEDESEEDPELIWDGTEEFELQLKDPVVGQKWNSLLRGHGLGGGDISYWDALHMVVDGNLTL